jgi:hypothetical protein
LAQIKKKARRNGPISLFLEVMEVTTFLAPTREGYLEFIVSAMILIASVGFLGYCRESEVAREKDAHLDALGVDCCRACTACLAGNLEHSVLNRGGGPNHWLGPPFVFA